MFITNKWSCKVLNRANFFLILFNFVRISRIIALYNKYRNIGGPKQSLETLLRANATKL